MRNFNFPKIAFASSLAVVVAVTAACSGKINTDAKDPKWDRDVCEACKMLVSDKHFTAQMVDSSTGKRYYFDDLGCLFNWLAKQKPEVASRAVFYATDAKSGKWVDVNKGVIAETFVTPMSFGFGVFASEKDVPADKKILTVDEVKARLASKK